MTSNRSEYQNLTISYAAAMSDLLKLVSASQTIAVLGIHQVAEQEVVFWSLMRSSRTHMNSVENNLILLSVVPGFFL